MPANYVVMYDVLDRDQVARAAEKAMSAFTSMMVKAKSFYAEDICTGCKKCGELCPLDNISYKQGKPVWGENCMHCMACISACPVEAIQYGKGTKTRNRYYLSAK